MHQWFTFALLIILLLINWINGLYHDLDDVKFDNEIYQIRLHDYDSILVEKNHKIDSLINQLSKPIPSSPVFIPTKPFNRPITDTIKKDTLIINSDTTIIINDTIK